MGKLGKKARKFAKKNLQSVLKRKRKNKSMFKKKASKNERDAAENKEEEARELSNRRNHEGMDIEDTSLDEIFSEDDSDVDGDDSGSDGYLLEDSSDTYVAESHLEENGAGMESSVQNQEILSELESKMKKLERLKKKDPEFSRFLESHDRGLKSSRNEDAYSDDDETSNDDINSVDDDGPNSHKNKLLTNSVVNSWCNLIKEQQSVPALISLLNGYRAACHYGAESTGALDAGSSCRIQESETFCKILTFVLHEADNVFRGMLGISSSSSKRGTILELKNTPKWKTLRPLIKSYLRSTMFMLNQATDSEILALSLSRLRASVVFFAAFPPLLHRLIKIGVHLWATGEGILSSHSFLLLQDVSSVFSSDFFDICLIKMFKAFIGHCKFVEPALFKHIQFLRNSFVELCSQDLQKSSSKAMISIQKMSRILQLGLQTKKKEAVKKICSWQFTNCIDLWVTYISHNVHDYDLQPLIYIIIQIINGVAVLFPGPRYLPLRRKCVEWLNHLSSASGIFIPVTSLVLDLLGYKIGKEGGKPGKDFNFSSAVKLPKHLLKSRNFQEECVFTAIELLSVHFAQWSYNISFPELATIPLIRLRKFHEKTAIESFRRVVKRFVDMVEQNIEFVRKKREEVAFSPKDQQSVETFLQLEKQSGNAPFTQYYKSVMERAASGSLILNGKISNYSCNNFAAVSLSRRNQKGKEDNNQLSP
ncbi:nucleolar complex protein 2 homolog isoform X2 [Pistacia vera]|uniref:nucleolar complex protein 2 homolog isoform X2 n=1 Tax=Pistacia vera TaxID=55513 RepID=UPI001262D797|nr:nucleolar complex protein 2 homolog isoform X2 [Pistacia vera]